ncbi:hypothetical protein Q8W71_27175 [Methylobacterium sp. NEAU 140]|uniref:DUF6894 family protein n=1 Tax=Methylobacterium sp. NEAU 140 TaxID=3064945 RepID=UPI002735B149|nr:hypothetical protein [Methylobacterium sp. NEAU 140]MDP4026310.1 hypothetical protein [Methylobacterium sp. NEAU 140]
MPRFFFDLDGEITSRDHEGRDLPDRITACRTAIEIATEFAMTGVGLPSGSEAVVQVRRNQNEVVCTVRLNCRIESI